MENEKRKQIEAVLGQFLGEEISTGWQFALDILGLSRQATLIECDVEHTYDREGSYGTQFPMTIIKKGVFVLETLPGHHGREGEALAIILPLGEDFEEFIRIETEAAIEGGIIDENTGLPFDLEEEKDA